MLQQASGIRPFIGAKDYQLSRSFYQRLGFGEVVLSDTMSLFKTDRIAFYLQHAYVPDWVDNTMVFVEVPDADACWKWLVSLQLPEHYTGARVSPVRTAEWGKECFLHDPSGILWHFGTFAK